jgi:8-oxo-dGTP diphosphatase
VLLIGYKILASIWATFPEWVRWRLLWLLNPKMVVGVSGVLLNEKDEILLLKHRFHPRYPWGLPGGWIERGERVDEAWLREIREETSLAAKVEGIVVQRSTPLSLEFILMGRVAGGELVHDECEILEARFFQYEALPAGIHADHLEAIRRVHTSEFFLKELPPLQSRQLSEKPTV